MRLHQALLLIVLLLPARPIPADEAAPADRAATVVSADAGRPSETVICIDPGHPSETSAGTVSRDGTLTERHVDWVVALRLRDLLEQSGYRVVLTKSSEQEMVTNQKRAEIANDAHAALFLRLHCDSAATNGLAIYYPDRQGRSHGVVGPSEQVIRDSRSAAVAMHAAVIDALTGKLRDRGVHGESATRIGARQGALTGSIYAHVPAVTVEMVVLDNAHDFALARTESGQNLLARALFAGVIAYVKKPVVSR
jgi:N-acetylmuramoyl-L-alanine amidase